MDYTKCFKEVIQNYPFIDPIVEFIRHNENITFKVTAKGSEDTYLLRMHKPITKNMQGLQNTCEAIQSELIFLLAWSSHSELPVQIPVPNLDGELVTSDVVESEEVHCSVLKWIFGETMSKKNFTSEEMVGTLGKSIAELHQFSRSFKHDSNFIRPEYGIESVNIMLSKLRSGEKMGVIATEEFQILENAIFLVTDRMKNWSKSFETWGLIHGDIHYSNLVRTSTAGFGYYASDVAMGALFTKNELRDDLLSGYTSAASGRIDIAQLEELMFLNICELYAFRLSTKEMHMWIREHLPSLIELCKSLLKGKTVFYNINQVGLAI